MAKDAEIKLILNTQEAIKEAQQFSKDLKKSLDIQSDIPAIKNYQGILRKALTDMDRIGKNGNLTGGFSSAQLQKDEKELQKVVDLATQLDAVNTKLAEKQATLPSLRGKIGGAKTPEDKAVARENYATAKAEVEDLVGQQTVLATQLDQQMGKVGKIVGRVQEVSQFSQEYKSKVDGINNTYDELVAKVDQSAQAEQDASASAENLSSTTKETSAEFENAGNSAEQITNKVDEANTATKQLNATMKEAPETKTGVAAGTEEISEAAKYANMSFIELMRTIEQYRTTLAGLDQDSEEAQAITQQLADASQAFSEKQGEMQQALLGAFQGDSGQIIQSITSGLDGVGSAFGNAGNYAINFADIMNIVRLCMGDVSAAVPLITSMFSKLTNAINGVIETIKNLISNMIKFTTSVANKFFSVMKNGLSGLSRAGNSIGGSDNPFDPKNIKRALQLLTKYVFGFRSFFFLYRRLRKLVGEGLENLVQFESETNKTNAAITELRTSLLFIKNAWAAAFAPIINIVQPILTYLMDAIANVGNAIARFVGALTGQSVVLNAVRVDAGDYAKSLDKAGGSAGRAADKTKKLTDRLAAFDDLNVLGIDRDPDGTGSGGGGGGADSLEPDPNQMFKYVEAVSSFATMIKDAWKKVDFTEVGKVIRDKLLEALRTPFGKSWKELQDLAYNAGRGLITFLNGVFEDKRLWMEVGNAIGEGLNTVGRFVEGLLKNNKINFGLNFAELIISAFKSFDPHLFLSNAERIVNLLVDNINAFFERIFASRGEKGNLFGNIQTLAEGLTRSLINLILGINWDTIAQTALLIGDAILNGIRHALEDSDNPFMQDIGKFILEIQWAVHELLPALEPVLDLLGEIAGEAIKDIVDLLPIVVKIVREFVRKWLPQLLDFLKEAMPVIKWIATEGLSLILGALELFDFEGLVKGVLSVLSVIMLVGGYLLTIFNPLLGIATMIGGLIIGIARVAEDTRDLLNLFFPSGEAIIQGLFDGISNALNGVYEWFRTNVFEPIATTFTTLFGIHSPSTVFAEYGDDIIQGLLDGINARIEEVLQVFIDLKNNISEKWDDIKSATAQKWTEIGEAVKNKVFDIKNNIVGEFSDIKDKIVQKFTEIVGGISEAFSSLKEAVKAPLNAAIDVIESFVNKVIKGINDLVKNFDGISEIASEVGLTVPELKIPTISIPRLAQGAVIPPNREFMAVLGDQSHGTNIEAPLDTIKQAVAEVMGTNAGNQEVVQLLQQLITVVENKNLTIGDKEIGKANARYTNQQRMIRGTSF